MIATRPDRNAILLWIVATAVAAVAAWGVVALILEHISWGPWLAGLGLAEANALAAVAVSHRATSGAPRAFVRWGLYGNGLRILVLLSIMYGFSLAGKASSASFFVAVLTGFFVLLGVEIRVLHKAAGSGTRTT